VVSLVLFRYHGDFCGVLVWQNLAESLIRFRSCFRRGVYANMRLVQHTVIGAFVSTLFRELDIKLQARRQEVTNDIGQVDIISLYIHGAN
jgi:hypothetical protein